MNRVTKCNCNNVTVLNNQTNTENIRLTPLCAQYAMDIDCRNGRCLKLLANRSHILSSQHIFGMGLFRISF